MVGIADGEPPAGEQRSEIQRRGRLERRHVAVPRDEHQAIARERLPAARLDQAQGLHMVHPCRVGGEEDIGRCAALDLPRERRGPGVGGDHAVLGPGVELPDRLVDRVSAARGRQDDRALGRRRPRPYADEEPGERQPKRPKRR